MNYSLLGLRLNF